MRPMAHHPELEAALLADPDRLDAYLVYSDFLSQEGDPRGALIAAQVERERAEADQASQLPGSEAWRRLQVARERERRLFDQHRADFLGALGEPSAAEIALTWRRGFIDSARIAWSWFAKEGPTPVPALVEALFSLPTGRFVRELTFGVHIEEEGQGEYQPVIDALAARPRPSLRRLHVGDFRYHGAETEISWTHLGDLSDLWEALPRLEHLELQGGDLSLGDEVSAPSLRRLEIRSGGLPGVVFRQLGAGSWPKLEHLSLWFGRPDYGGDASLDDVRALLEGEGLPALRHLGLANGELANELCNLLPDAPLLGQLASLDLSMGIMTDPGAAALLARREAFSHLERLDLEDNYLTPAMTAQLGGLCREVRCEEQRRPSEYGGMLIYYTSVGE